LALVDNNQPLPTLKALQARYLGKQPVPIIPARQQDLASYTSSGQKLRFFKKLEA
jgi:hypothetical protein